MAFELISFWHGGRPDVATNNRKKVGACLRWGVAALGAILIVTVAAAGKAHAAPTAKFTQPGFLGFDIIIVAGQSNAVGWGVGYFFDPYASSSVDANIFQLGRYGAQAMQVVPATMAWGGNTYDALQHWGISFYRAEMGFSIPFARRYVTEQLKQNRAVLIIPAAYGGSSILKWFGDVNQPATNPVALYDDMLARTRYTLGLPGDNRVVAFLWHQGETDVIYDACYHEYGMNANLYQTKLTTLVQKVRADLPANPPFPIIAGEFAQSWSPVPGCNFPMQQVAFQNVTRAVMSADGYAGVATSSGLLADYPTYISDPTQWYHFSSAALVTLGDRYYQVWKSLVHP